MTLHKTNGALLALGATAALGALGAVKAGSPAKYKGKLRHFDDEFKRLFGSVAHLIEASKDQNPDLVLARIGQTRDAKGAVIVPMMMNYYRSGKQDLVVGPKLRRMFEDTSVANVPWDMVRMPYKAFIINLPECDWPLWSPTEGGVTAKVRWLLVKAQAPGLVDILALGPRGEAHEMVRLRDQGKTPWLDASHVIAINPESQDLRPGLPSEMVKPPDLDLEEYIEVALLYSTRTLYPGDPRFMVRFEEIAGTYRNITRVVINLALYLQSRGAVVEETGASTADEIRRRKIERSLQSLAQNRSLKERSRRRQREKLEKQLQKASGPVVSVVAPAIEEERKKEEAKARNLPRGHWVRGHWRLQARKGPRSDWYLIWIQPHWKTGTGKSRITQKTQHLEVDDE